VRKNGSLNPSLIARSISGVNQAFPINLSDLHGSFCDLESTIEAANVSMDSYEVLTSPGVKKILRTTPSFANGSLTTWSELRDRKVRPRSPMVDVLPGAGIT
jgi:hypothetical protein